MRAVIQQFQLCDGRKTQVRTNTAAGVCVRRMDVRTLDSGEHLLLPPQYRKSGVPRVLQ